VTLVAPRERKGARPARRLLVVHCSGAHASGPRGSFVLVDLADTRAWFNDYLLAFAACGRGASDDLGALIDYYGVPLLLTTDADAVTLMTEADVLDAIGGQIAGLRAAGYHRTETLDSETTVISATTALHAAEFSRQRADGSEIGRLRARYLITLGAHGRRISALAVHSA
jgi:hypothetical protein